jgi:hypothetical protein
MAKKQAVKKGAWKPALTPKKRGQVPPPVPTPDKSWHEAFLRSLAAMPNVRLAARSAGVSRQDAYKHREMFADFAERWDEAKEAAVDSLELKAWTRASKASDTLTIFMLKAHRPQLYRDKLDVAFDLSNLTDEELMKLAEIRAKLNTKS